MSGLANKAKNLINRTMSKLSNIQQRLKGSSGQLSTSTERLASIQEEEEAAEAAELEKLQADAEQAYMQGKEPEQKGGARRNKMRKIRKSRKANKSRKGSKSRKTNSRK
jgi:hypothetical protein